MEPRVRVAIVKTEREELLLACRFQELNLPLRVAGLTRHKRVIVRPDRDLDDPVLQDESCGAGTPRAVRQPLEVEKRKTVVGQLRGNDGARRTVPSILQIDSAAP